MDSLTGPDEMFSTQERLIIQQKEELPSFRDESKIVAIRGRSMASPKGVDSSIPILIFE